MPPYETFGHMKLYQLTTALPVDGTATWPQSSHAEEHTPRVPVDEHGAGDGCFTHGRGEPPCPKAFIWLVKVIDNCWEGTVRYLLPW